jgi:hypothetical protein
MATTNHLLMIRPVNFGYNPETAVNNAFQLQTTDANTQDKAVKEFDDFVSLLRSNGVDVTIVQDSKNPHTPDSIFPNNWVSFHEDGSLLLYPMYAVNRRAEGKNTVLDAIDDKFVVRQKIDLSGYENENIFLEGTGSMVLDRDFKLAYACLSPRTNDKILRDFCTRMDYQPVLFTANDSNGKAIYHTNVMMCVADQYIVICLDSISNTTERELVKATISKTGKQIVTISLDQMNHFAGNMLQVESKSAEKLLIMSSQAYHSLSTSQVETLQQFNRILHSPLETIETNGGGSARCMMAEVFLAIKD